MPSNKTLDAAFALLKTDPSNKLLGLTTGKHTITEPGQFVPKAGQYSCLFQPELIDIQIRSLSPRTPLDTQNPPQLTCSTTSPTKTYLAISLDPDAPFATFPVLGPILHWIQPGLKPSASNGLLESTEPFIANCEY